MSRARRQGTSSSSRARKLHLRAGGSAKKAARPRGSGAIIPLKEKPIFSAHQKRAIIAGTKAVVADAGFFERVAQARGHDFSRERFFREHPHFINGAGMPVHTAIFRKGNSVTRVLVVWDPFATGNPPQSYRFFLLPPNPPGGKASRSGGGNRK